MTDIESMWHAWILSKTDAFQFLLKFLFSLWDINIHNNFRGFIPQDIVFSKYISGKGIYNHTQNKEVYHFSLHKTFFFYGRIYPLNFQFFKEKEDLFLYYFTHKIIDTGTFSIYEDILIHDDVLSSSDTFQI